MRLNAAEIHDVNSRAAQMFLDLAEFERCETLSDFIAARDRLREKALKAAAESFESRLKTDDR